MKTTIIKKGSIAYQNFLTFYSLLSFKEIDVIFPGIKIIHPELFKKKRI